MKLTQLPLLFLKPWPFVFWQSSISWIFVRGNHGIILNPHTILTYIYILYVCVLVLYIFFLLEN